MEASFYLDENQRTIIRATAGYDVAEQRIRIYAPNGEVFDLYGGYPNFGTVSFAIEDRANQFISCYPNSVTGHVFVALEQRYQILGNYTSWSEQEKYEVIYPINKNQWTAPSIDKVSFAPTETFLEAGMYVKSKNGVIVSEVNATARLSATITDIKWYIEGVGGELYSVGEGSINFRSYGQVPITFKVRDSRGFEVTRTDYITVYDYFKPYISPPNGADRILAVRVDNSGVITDGGTTLKISAGKRYAGVNGKNRCRLMYRIKTATGEWSDYINLLSETSSENDYTADVRSLDEHTVYRMELVVVDAFGEWEAILYDLLTEEVYMYRSGSRRSIAFGGHVTKDDSFEVYWGGHFYGGLEIEPEEGKRGLVLHSSTAGSSKKYEITVNDSGVISAKQI